MAQHINGGLRQYALTLYLSPMIRLFTTAYPETNKRRIADYNEALRRNLALAEIDEVCLLAEGENLALPDSPKLRVQTIPKRPLYEQYFAWTEKLAQPQDISIIANSDIYFDRQLGLFKVWELPERTVMALSRWNIFENGIPTLFDRNDSQDTWIFRGPVRGVHGDFPIGVPRCDNRILHELHQAGYRVINPSFSIRTFHLHAAGGNDYTGPVLAHHVKPPYRYLFPHNLWSGPRTLWHNLWHRKCPIEWRLDGRWLARTFPGRVFDKVLRACGSHNR